ncbi:MAG: peptidylprolyl isomerase [Elusimicrobia bacterium]|nr:peptidylprolyl isomerase [Elusimicrobiota bacterium]
MEIKKQFQTEDIFKKQLEITRISLDDIKSEIRLNVYKEKLLGDRLQVLEAEIKNYFDNNRKQMSQPEQIHLKHILVSTEQEAKDLLISIKVGANFDLLAKEKSLDTASKNRGGDLGFLVRGMFSPEIQERVFSMADGAIEIVRTQLGFHIMKVVERKPAQEPVWNKETKAMVERIIKQVKFSQEYPKYIQNLRNSAQIQIFLNP